MTKPERRLVEGVLDGDSDAVAAATDALGGVRTHHVLLGAFVFAVQRQFSDDVSPAEVSAYVADLRRRLENGERLNPMPTEALIRAVLHDPDLREGIDKDDAARTYLAVTFAVGRDHGIEGPAREEFVREVLEAVS